MKQVLSIDQVNANLSGNTNLKCFKVEYSHYNNEPYYHFTLREKALVVAFGKKVYYHELKGENERGHKGMAMELDGLEYVPLLDKKEAERLLIICGLKVVKKVTEVKPEQRLKELQCGNLVPIYKMIMEIDLISADLEIKHKKDYWGNEDKKESFMALVVRHSHGSFSIPIENIAPDQEHTEEIQNIFFNALNLPVTSKLKTA